ncbi:MAG: thioredoxin family protein [Actinomycetota bacterium]
MAVASTMLPLGTQAPDFSLPATDGSTFSLDSFGGSSALLVAFICNHCPYVRHVQDELAALSKEYMDRGVAIVGICSNDADAYPDDAPAELAAQKERVGFPFPYLVDESQEVAKAYTAACTPDLFLFDAGRRLAYRGQMDSSRPRNQEPVTGEDLRAALEALLSGGAMPEDQRPSLGCGIKWKPGNEPDY